MRQIKAQPLTREAFRKYGTFQNLLDDADMAKASFNPAGFFPDLIDLNFGTTTIPSVCCCSVTKREKNVIAFMEFHQYTCEGLLAIDADVIIYCGAPRRGVMHSEDLEAFILPKGTMLKYNPMVIHGGQFPINTDAAHLLCLLPQRTFYNDCVVKRIENEDDMVEVSL